MRLTAGRGWSAGQVARWACICLTPPRPSRRSDRATQPPKVLKPLLVCPPFFSQPALRGKAVQVFAGSNEELSIADRGSGTEVFGVVGHAIGRELLECVSRF